jgi:hypothetical protein
MAATDLQFRLPLLFKLVQLLIVAIILTIEEYFRDAGVFAMILL